MKTNTISPPGPHEGESMSLREYREVLAQRVRGVDDLIANLPQDNPLWIEFGCGHGHYLQSLAARHPDTFYLGLDLATGRIGRAQRKASRLPTPNCRFVQADNRLFIKALPGCRVSGALVLFPDPFPKLRQRKHRLLDQNFLAHLHRILLPDGRFFFKTDVEDYFSEVREMIKDRVGEWTLLPGHSWPEGPPTIFESKAQQVHALVARKK